MKKASHITPKVRSQKFLRNFIAALSLGKAGVIGAGVALALVGYVEIARSILPANLFDMVVNGLSAGNAASLGGVLGVCVALIVSIVR